MLNVAIVTGSTRPGRKSATIAQWVHEIAARRDDANYEILDIADFNLPLLDEAMPPAMGQYSHEHTKRWADAVNCYDAFVFVSPEYNHGIPGALKNAIDFIYAEWTNKAAGLVTYGGVGGVRAAEQLRLVLAEVQIATVRAQVSLFLATDFEQYTTFAPHSRHEAAVTEMLDQTVRWGQALRTTRTDPSS